MLTEHPAICGGISSWTWGKSSATVVLPRGQVAKCKLSMQFVLASLSTVPFEEISMENSRIRRVIHFLRPEFSHEFFGALDSLNQMGALVVGQHWIVDGTTLGTCQNLARRSCLTVPAAFPLSWHASVGIPEQTGSVECWTCYIFEPNFEFICCGFNVLEK